MTMNAPESENASVKSMEQIVSLAKRRGFVFPASEIYGGINGFWDFGPLGVQLKNNLRDAWWHDMVVAPPIGPDGTPLSIVGLDSAIIQNPKVWVSSGHVGGFNDPMQTCRQCKKLFRADHILDMLSKADWVASFCETLGIDSIDATATLSGEDLSRWAKNRKGGKKLASGMALVRKTEETVSWLTAADTPDTMTGLDLARLLSTENRGEEIQNPCPNCAGDLTPPRDFNLMFESFAGAVKDDANKVYLRPETAQGIFLNYKNVVDTSRVKMPFGIAQVGKAFRNEVTPRNFIFRSREFEQMEMEWFCPPAEAPQWFDFWKETRRNWWISLGVDPENLILRDHDLDELSHYAKEGSGTADVEYRYPFTHPHYGELEGIAHRTDFDLKAHQASANVNLSYLNHETRDRYIPHVIEPASGLTRGVLALLCEAFTPDESRPSKVFMKFSPRMAPIKAAIFPLVNKEGMPEVAQKLYMKLRQKHAVQFDVKQNIGKRYARMDEAGTPYCFTIDGETLQDQTVTVRDRDTLSQDRINIDQVESFLAEKITANTPD